MGNLLGGIMDFFGGLFGVKAPKMMEDKRLSDEEKKKQEEEQKKKEEEQKQAEGAAARGAQASKSGPVSYTHLDVYKRQ